MESKKPEPQNSLVTALSDGVTEKPQEELVKVKLFEWESNCLLEDLRYHIMRLMEVEDAKKLAKGAPKNFGRLYANNARAQSLWIHYLKRDFPDFPLNMSPYDTKSLDGIINTYLLAEHWKTNERCRAAVYAFQKMLKAGRATNEGMQSIKRFFDIYIMVMAKKPLIAPANIVIPFFIKLMTLPHCLEYFEEVWDLLSAYCAYCEPSEEVSKKEVYLKELVLLCFDAWFSLPDKIKNKNKNKNYKAVARLLKTLYKSEVFNAIAETFLSDERLTSDLKVEVLVAMADYYGFHPEAKICDELLEKNLINLSEYMQITEPHLWLEYRTDEVNLKFFYEETYLHKWSKSIIENFRQDACKTITSSFNPEHDDSSEIIATAFFTDRPQLIPNFLSHIKKAEDQQKVFVDACIYAHNKWPKKYWKYIKELVASQQLDLNSHHIESLFEVMEEGHMEEGHKEKLIAFKNICQLRDILIASCKKYLTNCRKNTWHVEEAKVLRYRLSFRDASLVLSALSLHADRKKGLKTAQIKDDSLDVMIMREVSKNESLNQWLASQCDHELAVPAYVFAQAQTNFFPQRKNWKQAHNIFKDIVKSNAHFREPGAFLNIALPAFNSKA